MRAMQALPTSYQEAGTLDISKDQRLLVILNLFGLLIIGLAGWLFFRALFILRANESPNAILEVQVSSLADLGKLIFFLLALTAFYILLHEAIHGIFFWIYTRTRPKFAFRWSYAYAAAPDWFLPRFPFLVTTLAPLVIISLAGVILLSFVPSSWLLPIWFVITMNAGGAIGDILVSIWLLRHPANTLVRDRGDAVTLYTEKKFTN